MHVIVFGGPNGAGKTTLATTTLRNELGIEEFVNADEIGRGLSPFNPEGAEIAAGRVLMARIRELTKAERDFAFETTLAGRTHARLLRSCRQAGYQVTLSIFGCPRRRSPSRASRAVSIREVTASLRRSSDGGTGPDCAIFGSFTCRWRIAARYTTIPPKDESSSRKRSRAKSLFTTKEDGDKSG
jgi:hypothetical protein